MTNESETETGLDFAESLAAATPTPGGGAAAARGGLLATSLVRMVTGISAINLSFKGIKYLRCAAQCPTQGHLFQCTEAVKPLLALGHT